MGTKTIHGLEFDVPVIKLDSKDSKTATFKPERLTSFFNSGMLADLPKVTGFKLKIQKKSPDAQEFVDGIKKWKCPNCHRDAISSQHIKSYLCGCGEYMREL